MQLQSLLPLQSAHSHAQSVPVSVGVQKFLISILLAHDNMLSAELSFPGFAAVGAAATYDWLNPFNTVIPWNHKGEWNWYMGVGGGASYWFGGFLNVGVAGRIGVEYDFWFPLQLSFDWRPVIGPDIYFGGAAGDSETHVGFSGYGFYAGAISLGVRYKF